MKSKFNESSKALMICDLANSIVRLFGETFLVAYFLEISNENIIQISIYYIIIYTLLGTQNLILGRLMKSKPYKRITVYRVGIIVKSVFILLIVLFKEQISNYYVIFAIFYGIAEALYWSAHDVMNIDVVDNFSRKKYMVVSRIAGKVIDIIIPIVLGISINLSSFVNMAIYIFAITLIQIIVSFRIELDKFTTKGCDEKYSLRNYIKKLSQEQKIKFGKMCKIAFLYGVIMDIIRVLVIVITIMTFKTSLNLGILTTIFSICQVVSLYIFNKLYQEKYAKGVLSLCSILAVLGVLGLIFNIDKTTLILYNFTYSITICVLEVMFKIKSGKFVKEENIEEWIIEYHTFIELFMDIGRITGFLFMIIIGLLNNVIYFKILLLIVTICIPLYAKIMYETEK